MRYRLWMLPAVALGCGLTTGAMANDRTLSYGELETLLDKAESYGFSRFEKLDIDHDDDVLELEGWRPDGWELDVSMQLQDGVLVRESQRKSSAPDWSLTRQELEAALENASQRGMQRFDELEVDSDGHIEIDGYNAEHHDLDFDLHRDDLTATGETG